MHPNLRNDYFQKIKTKKAVKLNYKYLVSRSIVDIMSKINEENERSNNSRQINYWSLNYTNRIKKYVRLW